MYHSQNNYVQPNVKPTRIWECYLLQLRTFNFSVFVVMMMMIMIIIIIIIIIATTGTTNVTTAAAAFSR